MTAAHFAHLPRWITDFSDSSELVCRFVRAGEHRAVKVEGEDARFFEGETIDAIEDTYAKWKVHGRQFETLTEAVAHIVKRKPGGLNC